MLAHEAFVRALRRGGEVCLIGSEEHAEAIPLLFDDCQGKYVVLFDPLDGSSNIDVNISIGTIFSIYRIPDDHVGKVTIESALQCGRQQVAAGYIVYGSSTILVYTIYARSSSIRAASAWDGFPPRALGEILRSKWL